ncbi:unnamed protein product [Ectocarpus sp. 13 AM-2016]
MDSLGWVGGMSGPPMPSFLFADIHVGDTLHDKKNYAPPCI